MKNLIQSYSPPSYRETALLRNFYRNSHIGQPRIIAEFCTNTSMTVFVILQNWKDYDFRKETAGDDPRYFNCDADWEVDFLVSKIQHIYHFVHDIKIRDAIRKVCVDEIQSKERQSFVNAVLESLAIPAS